MNAFLGAYTTLEMYAFFYPPGLTCPG